jgi:hypothetical protein
MRAQEAEEVKDVRVELRATDPKEPAQLRYEEGQRSPQRAARAAKYERERERDVPVLEVVWSAIIAFTVARYVPSKIPPRHAAAAMTNASVVSANAKIMAGPIDPSMSRRFPPCVGELPKGIAKTAMAMPSTPSRIPTVDVETPTSGDRLICILSGS